MYKISRGFSGRLTEAQRRSASFAEEPRVLGRILRRSSAPFMVNDEVYQRHQRELTQLMQAGAIAVEKIEDAPSTAPAQVYDPEPSLPAPRVEPESDVPAAPKQPEQHKNKKWKKDY